MISIHPKRQRLLRLVNLSQPTWIVNFVEPTRVRSWHSSYQWVLHSECPSKYLVHKQWKELWWWYSITIYILQRRQKQGESVQNIDSFIEGENRNYERIMNVVNCRMRQRIKNIILLFSGDGRKRRRRETWQTESTSNTLRRSCQTMPPFWRRRNSTMNDIVTLTFLRSELIQ